MEFELVIFDGQQIVPSAFQHDVASRFGLGVEGIQPDQSAVEVQVWKELLRHGNLVGLGVDHRAGQVILAGHTDGSEHALTAAVFGLFAVQGDQLVLGRWPAQLRLNLQQHLLQVRPIDLLQQTPKGWLAWGRVAALALANAQSAALGLAEFAREFGQILRAAGRPAKHRQEVNGQQ